GYRYNSAERVYEHMQRLGADFGVRHINIYDDLCTPHRGRITTLCEMLIRDPLGMRFNCAVRVGHADDELLKMLKAAGFLQLSVGIETGDADLMAIHKPGVNLDGARETVKRIQAHGLRAKGLFMMGLPGDTEASIRATSEFVLSLGLDDMNMSKFTPFPGAPVWSTIRETGDLENDWPRMNCLNFVYLPKDVDSRETLDYLHNQHVKSFYSVPAWRKRFRGRIWSHRWSLWRLIRHMPTFAA
ncbi:MAG: radical SAM protein, partial [Desulfobacterales bacterium]|nr:radical SAM protein [Desulfobacterales bacterium]